MHVFWTIKSIIIIIIIIIITITITKGTRWRTRWRHGTKSRNIVSTIPDGQHYGPGVDSASNRNEYERSLLES